MLPPDEDFPELSESEAALVEAWIASRMRKPHASREALTGSLFVRYLASALPDPEAEILEERLLRDPEARQMLMTVELRLREMRRQSWSEVLRQALRTGDPDPIALAWRDHLNECARAAGETRLAWLRQGWQAVLELTSQGQAYSHSIRAALAGCRQAILDTGPLSLEPAAVRGAESTSTKPYAIEAAEVSIAGVLKVEAVAPASRTDAPTQPSGGEPPGLRLSLRTDTGFWPLAETGWVEGRVRWEVEGFGNLLGLEPGPLSHDLFAVTETEYPSGPAAQSDIRERIPLRVEAASGWISGWRVPFLELAEPVTWTSGEWVVPAILPEELAGLPGAWRLAFCLQAGRNRMQILAEWPLEACGGPDWTPRFSAPFGPDARLPWMLQAVLLPGAEPGA